MISLPPKFLIFWRHTLVVLVWPTDDRLFLGFQELPPMTGGLICCQAMDIVIFMDVYDTVIIMSWIPNWVCLKMGYTPN